MFGSKRSFQLRRGVLRLCSLAPISDADSKSCVEEIPSGRVTSYGHIARLLGKPECPRQVGVCLKHLPSWSTTTDHHFHDANVPWQRVINAKGIISPRGPGGATRQAAVLRSEGVTVGVGHLGELSVDLAVYGWFPAYLPSDEAEASESMEEESNG